MNIKIAAMIILAGLAASSPAVAGEVDFDGTGEPKTEAAPLDLKVPAPTAVAAVKPAGADKKDDYLYIGGKGFALPSDRKPGEPRQARPVGRAELESASEPIRMAVLSRMSAESKRSLFRELRARALTEECWEGESNVQQLSGGALILCKVICCAASPDDMHVPLPEPEPPTCNDFCTNL